MGKTQEGNKPKTAKDLIATITADDIVRAGYGVQPTAGSRVEAQHRIVHLIRASSLPCEKIKKVIEAIAPDDKKLTKMLSKSGSLIVRKALAMSDRELSPKVVDRLFTSDLETATAILESGRKPDQESFEKMFSQAMHEARFSGDYLGKNFVHAAIPTKNPLPKSCWEQTIGRWDPDLVLFHIPDAMVALAASGRKDMPLPVIKELLNQKRADIDIAFARAGHVQDPVIFETLARRGNPKALEAMRRNPAFAQFRDVPVRHLSLVS
jgi:hypothetical protein